jgi:3-oxoacyl-[acyl-carrier-protein] synthase III
MRSKIISYQISALGNVSKGYIPSATELALNCLLNNENSINTLDFLISTGIYREEHIVEPAISALILGKILDKTSHKKFDGIRMGDQLKSLDIHNGNAGLIQAIQLADLMIKKGKSCSGLIVSGDYISKPDLSSTNSIINGTAAILLSASQDETGFNNFYSETFSTFEGDFEGYSSLQNNKRKLVIAESERYSKHVVDCAIKGIDTFVKTNNIALNQVDYIISSSHSKELSTLIKSNWSFRGQVMDGHTSNMNQHSASLIYAMDRLFKSEGIAPGKNIIFLALGSGISISIAHYIS